MKRLLFILSIYFCFQLIIFAQGQERNANFEQKIGIIKGIVIDDNTLQPIEYATISLFKKRDSVLTGGTITNQEGIFILDNLQYGRYFIKINFIGYESTVIENIKVTPKTPTVYLNKIKYKPVTHNLQEVTITGNKPIVEYKLDKKVINVEQDMTSVGGTAIDVLKNAPSVTVDMDDKVSIRGSSNITILIDGKKSAFASSSDVLQQISASSINSIEIITNPSAKYDPDGLSGIINVKMKKNKQKGFNLSVSGNAGTSNHFNTSVNANLRITKFNFYTGYDFRNNMKRFSGTTNQVNTISDSVFYLTQIGNKQREILSHTVKAGINYYLNNNNTLSGSVIYRYREYGSSGNTNYLEENQDYKKISLYDVFNNDESNRNSIDVSLDYEKKFDNPEHKLTASATYSENISNTFQTIDYEYDILDDLEIDSVSKQQNYKDDYSKLSSIQTDYVHPFNEFTRFEIGYKSMFNNNDDDYLFENYDALLSNWIMDTITTNHFIYDEQIHSVYSMFSSQLFSFQWMIGVRLEQVYRNSQQKTTNKNFADDYFNYFPTLHISREFNKNNQLQLSYSRRINRPRSRMLNPFINYSNPLFLRQGNPSLMPELIDSYELNYKYRFKKNFLITSLFYKQINDAMSRYRQLIDDNNMLMTYVNIDEKTNYGIEFIGNFNLIKWWKINTNISYFKNIVDATNFEDNSTTNESMNWTARMTNMFSLNKDLSFQVGGNYFSQSATAQGSRGAMYMVDFGARKDFPEKNLSINLRFSDVLNTMRFHFITEGKGFYSDSEFKKLSRVIYIGATYRFNTNPNNGKIKKRNGNKFDLENMMDEMF
ncbi:MAG: TonB-dependent receptor [Bacteroidales bacterium]|nr:TonB-dependent receptor [Bacteroidales bacterium]